MPVKRATSKRSNGTKAGVTRNGSGRTAAKPRSRTARLTVSEVVVYEPSDEEIAYKAYVLWEHRGKPVGSPDEDWFRARQELYASYAESSARGASPA